MSTNDVLFLSKIFSFAYYFGITPFPWSKFNEPIKLTRKLFIFSLILISTFGTFNQIFLRASTSYKKRVKLEIVLNVFTTTVEAIIFITIFIVSNLIRSGKWRRLIQVVTDLEEYFANKYYNNKTIFGYFVNFVTPLLITLFSLIFFEIILKQKWIDLKYLFFQCLMLYQVYQMMLINKFLMYTRNRYNCLIKVLKSIPFKDDGSTELEDAVQTFEKLYELVTILNELFGPYIFIFILYFALLSIHYITILFYTTTSLTRYMTLFLSYIFTFAVLCKLENARVLIRLKYFFPGTRRYVN